jgi:hypothetical protein
MAHPGETVSCSIGSSCFYGNLISFAANRSRNQSGCESLTRLILRAAAARILRHHRQTLPYTYLL